MSSESEDDVAFDDPRDVESVRTFVFDDYIRRKARQKQEREVEQGVIECPEVLDKPQQLQVLMDNLDSEQQSRYEFFRRTNLNRATMKRATHNLGFNLPANAILALCAMSKLFIGDVVEKAKDVQRRRHKADLVGLKIKKREMKRRIYRESEKFKKEGGDIDEFKRTILSRLPDPEKVEIKVNENEPLLPEDIREAWRLYLEERRPFPSTKWHGQGNADGGMFR